MAAEKKLTRAEKTKLSEKMQMSLLKDIVHVVAGGHAIEIVEILFKKKNVNEFTIAQKMDLTINQARNILYRLSDEGMVHFMRKKDTKNGGWYTYFWTLDVNKSLTRLKEKLSHHVKELEGELHKRKTTQFYYSPHADIEYSEDKALEHDFICPETGEVMELKDTSDRVAEIEDALSNLSVKLEAIGEELSLIFAKEDAAKQRKMKAEQKKKDEEKAEKRKIAAEKRKATAAKNKALKEKEAKKSGKKVVKKKVVKKKAVKKKVAKKKAVKKKAVKKKAVKKKAASKKKVIARKMVKSAGTRTKKAKKVVRKKVSRAGKKGK